MHICLFSGGLQELRIHLQELAKSSIVKILHLFYQRVTHSIVDVAHV